MAGEAEKTFATLSGLPLEVCYGAGNGVGSAERPGEFPFTRGIHPTMYRGRLWTMRQYAGFGTATETNRRFKYLLEQGQSGLSVAFDLPTQMGYDSDHPLARGETGKVGVPIDSLQDMEQLFDGIALDHVSTSMTINATASILLALYIAVAENQGVPAAKLRGTIQNDILKEYVARGTYLFPPRPSMRLITDIFAYCHEHLPAWNTISISGYHIREAGATAVQEVAFTLANGLAYVQAAVEAGLKVDEFGARLSFFFNVHNDWLEELAKFRAARRLWAHLMRERFGATSDQAMKLRFHAQTAGSTLTAQQPQNNVVRVALQALAAVLGGAQSLHTNSLDEALSLPSEEAVKLALRTQQIIAYEAGVTKTVDPLGGAHAVEALTDAIEAEARAYLAKIDAMGGMLPAIEAGWVQHEIQESAYRYQRAIESGAQQIVGVNSFVEDEAEERIQPFTVPADLERQQCERLQALRRRRDAAAVARCLEALERAARGTENLMPHILEAVRSSVTLGELCETLRQVFGKYQPTTVI
ncbi:MAG: methylmalonyl-CoA mutase [Candidatus Tectomicrobia bacterium]|nr:methylmalonyl-CoA mutase [Candidatus Tectomicrobia bacterium]